ncbi:hypothetical protein SUGI_0764960 [Cryptomeria japonica]|nr:hypothetical protein SUGI_0764960 [Cryptomeria japonica]
MDRTLYAAVTRGNVDALAKLIDEKHETIGMLPLQMEPDHAPLHILNQLTPRRNTPLHLAAYYGHLQIVVMLLKVICDDIEAGNEESRQFIVAQNLQGETALHEAVKGGHLQIVHVLLQKSSELGEIRNNAGETALFKAAEEGHKDIVEKLFPLISPNYDRRARDERTPLHAAVSCEHKDVVEYLVDQKPELLKQADNIGWTPLHIVAYVKNAPEIARILLNKDASLCYMVDRNRQTALHIAVIEGNVKLVKEILIYSQDCLEIVDKDGRNAFHLVAENAVQIFNKISRSIKTLVLLLLISKKYVINDLDNNGKTPLDIVLEKMSIDERLFSGMKRLLKKNGARRTPNMMNNETLERSSATQKSPEKSQIVLVNAVLIATVAFQAVLTLPDKDHQTTTFLVFVLFNALAFCSSIATAVVLIYAIYGKQEDSLLVKTSVRGLWIALVGLIAAFVAAIYIFVESKYGWVKDVVFGMAVGVPIAIVFMVLRSKNYIFSEDKMESRSFIIVFVFSFSLLTLVSYLSHGKLISAIWTTLLSVYFLLCLVYVSFSKKTESVGTVSVDHGVIHNVFYKVWGKTICTVLFLETAVLWILYAV